MAKPRPPRRRLGPVSGPLVLLAATFVVKYIVFLQLRDHPLLAPDAGLDTTAYAQLATRVVSGDLWLGPGLYYVSPLYIYFLAGGLALLHSFTAVRFVQIVLGTFAVGGVFVAAREWFGDRAAMLAAAFAALTGLVTFYESIILQAAIDPFLTSMALAALAIGLKRRRGNWVLAAGVVFGLQTLNRPNVLLAAAALVVSIAAIRRFRWSALLAAGLVAGMLPSLVRNAAVSHQWTFVSSHGGLNFYIGNSETATGFYHQIPGITPTIGGQETDARRVAEAAVSHPLTDAQVSDYFFALGRTWMLAHPGAALSLFLRKLAYVFNAAHVALPHSYPFYAYEEGTLLRFLFVGPWLLIPLGLTGLALPIVRRAPGEYIVWAMFVPAYAAAVAVFFVAERYRLPMLLPLAIGAGAAIDAAWAAAGERRRGAIGIAAGVVAGLLVFVNWPLHLQDGRWEEGLRLAQRLVILGRYDEADRWTARMQDREPRPGATEFGVGAQLLVEKQFDRAALHLSRAVQRGYRDPSVESRLGEALLQSGRAAEAVPHLRRAIDAHADLPLGGYSYAKALLLSGDRPAALEVIRQLEPPADDADAWLMVARLALDAKAPDAAEPFFAHAARIRPADAAVRQQYGLNLLVLDRTADAARELAEAARLDPRDPDTLSRLAYCEMKLGRPADARTHAAAALALNPADPLARELLRSLSS